MAPAAAAAGGSPQLSVVDLPTLLTRIQPRGRPILVHHWASWDEPSTTGLPAMVALAARHGDTVDVVSVAWDELTDAPQGRIAGMAQRPAKWAGGEQAEAWARQAGVHWAVLVFSADPDAFFAALSLADRFVPQVTLYGADGARIAHHGGPMSGARWAAFEAAVEAAVDTASAEAAITATA
ncbi:MAG: hypothetical protein Q8P18_22320 [Pseudomonadota bacterium]|nr:hypothetical protein [Pseudomonadota bacterium]